MIIDNLSLAAIIVVGAAVLAIVAASIRSGKTKR